MQVILLENRKKLSHTNLIIIILDLIVVSTKRVLIGNSAIHIHKTVSTLFPFS